MISFLKNIFRVSNYLQILLFFTLGTNIYAMEKHPFTAYMSNNTFQGKPSFAYNETAQDYLSGHINGASHSNRYWQSGQLNYAPVSRASGSLHTLNTPYNAKLKPIYKMYLDEDRVGLSAKRSELSEQFNKVDFGRFEIHEQISYIDTCIDALDAQKIKNEQIDALHKLYLAGDIAGLETRKIELNEQLSKEEMSSQDHKEQVAYIDKCVQGLNQQKANNEAIYEKSEECFTPNMKNVSDQNSSKLRIILSTGDRDKLGKAMRTVINKSPGGLKMFFLRGKRAESDRYYDLAGQTETLHQLETTKLLFDVMNGDITSAQQSANIIATRKMNRISQEFIDFDPTKVAQEILAQRLAQEQSPALDDFDMVSTPAYNRTSNISPEVDQRIAEALSKIDSKTIDDLPQFLDAVGQVLDDLKQQGLLKPEEQINALGIMVSTYLQDMADTGKWKDSFVEFVEQQGKPMREAANAAYKDFCEKNPELNLPEDLDYGNIEELNQIISSTIDEDSNLSPEEKVYVDKARYVAQLTRTGVIYGAFLYAAGQMSGWESSGPAYTSNNLDNTIKGAPAMVTADGVVVQPIAAEAEVGYVAAVVSYFKDKFVGPDKDQIKNTDQLLEKESELTKEPKFVDEKRVPNDYETVLKDGTFKKTSLTVQDARVYKKNNKYYHRDQKHKGEGAHLEVYDKKGNHIGIADPITGELKPNSAVKGRNIKV